MRIIAAAAGSLLNSHPDHDGDRDPSVADRPTSYVGSRIARRLGSASRAAPNFIPRQVARLAPSATILEGPSALEACS
jgi:hypothetical protein